MDDDSIKQDMKPIYDLTNSINESDHENNKETIFVDGRSYEDHSFDRDEIITLVDVIDDNANVDSPIRDEVIKHAEKIVAEIAREIIPDIAKKIIKEEIEKIKKTINDK
ncbi:MAG: hypothetical protein QMD11_00720 [Smithella sp.]|nr:hypothetical protein [Smithella sp.]